MTSSRRSEVKSGDRVAITIPKSSALGALHEEEGASRRRVVTVLDPSLMLCDLGWAGHHEIPRQWIRSIQRADRREGPKTEPYAYEDGWYVQTVYEGARRRLKSYTALCSSADSPRGEYDEEVDVRAMGPAPAKRIVSDVLAKDYEPGMTVRRLIYRPEGVMFL